MSLLYIFHGEETMDRMFKSIKRIYKVLILFIDIVIIYGSFILAFLIKFNGTLPAFNFNPFIKASPFILIAAIVYIDMYKILAFYRKNAFDVLKSVGYFVSMLCISTIAVTYMLQGFSFPRSVLIMTPVIQFILLSSFNIALLNLRYSMLNKKDIMIIYPCNQNPSKMIDKIASFTKRDKIGKKLIFDLSQEKIIMRRLKDVDEIYISDDMPADFKVEIIKRCMGGKQVIYIVPQLFEISLINAKLMQLEDTPALMIGILGLTTEQVFVKRLFDVVVSLIGIIITTPLILIVAVLIKLTSKGPAFYIQERMTKGNRTFKLIKFRTMHQGAEDLSGPVLSGENDPRVTPLGKILRKTRIDELPQLFNVLKGDMSLVGPRPERPFFVEKFINDIPEYEYRFSVKAGITGFAQILGRYDTSPEDKLRYDLMYIRNYSLLLDIKLILQTIKVLFTPGSSSKTVHAITQARVESAVTKEKRHK